MTDAVIVSAVRTAIGEALRRAPGVDPAEIDDVVLGCAMPEAEQGLNVARIASLRAGIPVQASAITVNRFCASGLEAVAYAVGRVRSGACHAIVAGGTESMSLVPMGGNKVAPNPQLVATYPDVYLSTGLVAENHAREASVSRDDQDAYALRSHQRAVAAIDAGRFRDEIVPITVWLVDAAGEGAAPVRREVVFEVDDGPRRDTSLEALGKLKPAFHVKGSVTAGNSSQTSDGASALVVLSGDRARALRLTPLARLVAYATAGVAPERFGIGPVPAVRKVLTLAGLTLDQIDLVELNEAFAAQVMACLRELPIDPERLNVNGGAIALGHPLGCTGARLTTSLLYEMARRRARYGLVTMCVGGGMGAAGIFERLA